LPYLLGIFLDSEQAFGDVLREMRRRRGLSQEALALDAGIERNYVSLLELGKNSASIRMLFKLCEVLRVTPSAFLVDVERRMKE
jgi:transcriptional regulator with XRE-family HTH domain